MPIVFGLVGALAMGGGAAYTVSTGLVDIPGVTDTPVAANDAAEAPVAKPDGPKPAFVMLEPFSISVVQDGRPRMLRLTLTLETYEDDREAVETYAPRVLDALNTLLRAIDQRDLADPTALDRLRAQMLRRIRLATDDAPITNVLIVEYLVV